MDIKKDGFLLPTIEWFLCWFRCFSVCYHLNDLLDRRGKGGPWVSEFCVISRLIVGIIWIAFIQYPLLIGPVWTVLGIFIAFYIPFDIFLFSCCWLLVDKGGVTAYRRSLILFLLNLLEVGVFFAIGFLLLEWFDPIISPWSALFATLTAVLTLEPLTDVKSVWLVKWVALMQIGLVWLLIVLIIGNVVGAIERGEKKK